MGDQLGPAQRRILAVLIEDPWHWSPTAADVADAVARRSDTNILDRRPTAEAENAAGCLARLERRGLTSRARIGGHWVWSVTDAGRAAVHGG